MIGRYPHFIILQSKFKVSNGAGGFDVYWVQYGKSKARVAPITGRESVFAQRIQSETTHTITLPYRKDVKSEHRVVFDGRPFRIHSVINNNERGRYLVLECVEGEATYDEAELPSGAVTYKGAPVTYNGELVTYAGD